MVNQPKYATLFALWEFCVDKNKNDKIFKTIERNDDDSIDEITRAINGNSSDDVLQSRNDALNHIKSKL